MAKILTEEEKKNIPNYSDKKTKFDPYVGDEPYLFVSYSHRDTEVVYPILDRLHDKKYRIWYDESCETGNDFRLELSNKIQACAGILLFVSESSMNSPFCGMEILCAKENNKRIFPIYVGGDDMQIPPAFQIFLANLHHSSAKNINKMMESLLRDLPAEAMDRLTISEDAEKLEKCEDNGKMIEVPQGVKIICEGAFRYRSQFKKISLPDSLEKVEAEAFRSCTNLQAIDFPEKTYYIGDSAFRDCISLQHLSIKNGVVRIGERAFENCPELSDVELPNELAEIYASVFNGCKKLKDLKLPECLTVIGENAFGDCISLEEVILPKEVIKIDDLVFNGCIGLKKIYLPEGLKKIGKAAFKNCKALTQVYIPASVSYLSTDLFRGCSGMKSMVVDPKNRYYKSEPNKRDGKEHVLFNKSKSMIIAYPASASEIQYDVPDSVTCISDWTFSECKTLTRISIPDSVREIGEGAFSNCKKIDKMFIPDSVEKIDDCAFRGCDCLEKIAIPASVKDLGWGLFDGHSDNLVVYCEADSEIEKYCIRNRVKCAPIAEYENA